MNHNKHKKGYTIIELLIVLGFIASASAGTYGIYNYASDTQKVSSEIKKLSILRNKLENTYIVSDFSTLNSASMYMMGIEHNSEFKNHSIAGLSKESFKVNYSFLNQRQCNKLALKALAFPKTSVKISGIDVKPSPTDISSKCKDDFNTVDVVFNSVESKQQIAEVAKGTPKPAPIYAEEGTFIPELPYTDTSAVSFAQLVKPVEIPVKPMATAYVKPVAIAENANIPLYPDSNPLYSRNPPQVEIQAPIEGITTGQDTTNIRPVDPPIPPKPPALQKLQTGVYNFICNVDYNFDRYIFCLNSYYSNEFSNRSKIYGITVNSSSYEFDLLTRSFPKDRAFRAFGSRYVTLNGLVYDVNELYKTHRLYYLSGKISNDGDHYQGYLYGHMTMQLCEIGKPFTYNGKNIQCVWLWFLTVYNSINID